jgi:hypothetical protein
MTLLTDKNKFYGTTDADVVDTDIIVGKTAYGTGGKIVGVAPNPSGKTAVAGDLLSGKTAISGGGEITGTLPAIPTDPNFANVKFLQHAPLIGTGLSSYPTTYTQILADGVFGQTSIYTGVSGGNFNFTISAIALSDFTIETWLSPVSGGAGSSYGRIFQIGGSLAAGTLTIARNGSPDPLSFLVEYYSGGFQTVFATSGATVPNSPSWTHVAMVRSGSTYSFYIGGTRVGYRTSHPTGGGSLTGTTIYCGNNGASEYFKGSYCNTRLTVGTARYSGATITVPTDEFPTQ